MGALPGGDLPLKLRVDSVLGFRPLGDDCRLDEPEREGLRPRGASFETKSGFTWGDSQSFPFLQFPFTKNWQATLCCKAQLGLLHTPSLAKSRQHEMLALFWTEPACFLFLGLSMWLYIQLLPRMQVPFLHQE